MIFHEKDTLVKVPKRYKKMTIEQLEEECQKLINKSKARKMAFSKKGGSKQKSKISFYL